MENSKNINEDEIDLIKLFQKVWSSKKIIAKIVFVFFVIGILIALFSATQYTSSTVMVPQVSNTKSGGSLGSLAAIAGINLNATSTEAISPTLYPKIIESISFRQKLLQTPISVKDINGQITFREYYEQYAKISFGSFIKKYTLGLPYLLFNNKNEDEFVRVADTDSTIVSLNKKEFDLLNIIKEQIKIDVNEKEGYVTLSYNMPEALSAAQMLQNAQQLLQNSITEFKIKKAKEELSFIEERYAEVEKDFKEKQFALAQFQDQNRNLFSNLPQTRLQQLQTEYNLAYSIYSELAKQLETQKIKVKEQTPVFTIIEPITVPIERSKPKRTIIVGLWLFVGLVVGIGFVFGRDFIKQLKEDYHKDEKN